MQFYEFWQYQIFRAKQAEWAPLSIHADEYSVNGDGGISRVQYECLNFFAMGATHKKQEWANFGSPLPQKMGSLKYSEEAYLEKIFYGCRFF